MNRVFRNELNEFENKPQGLQAVDFAYLPFSDCVRHISSVRLFVDSFYNCRHTASALNEVALTTDLLEEKVKAG